MTAMSHQAWLLVEFLPFFLCGKILRIRFTYMYKAFIPPSSPFGSSSTSRRCLRSLARAKSSRNQHRQPFYAPHAQSHLNFGWKEVIRTLQLWESKRARRGLTDAEGTEVVSNILPMTFGRQIGLMLDANVGTLLLFSVEPVPACAVSLAAGKGM